MPPDITVLIPTRNRAAPLRKTLESMTKVQRDGLAVEFVVLDNGSIDGTDAVLREFSGRLPLRTVWVPKPGKNHAINRALDQAPLGEVVVFTDDDVSVEESWLVAILDACRRWPRHSIFGGRIDPVWPDSATLPAWAYQYGLQMMAFSRHRLDQEEGEYPKGWEPFGPNFWMRREAIGRHRMHEAIGPHPTRRKVGGETEFLLRLRRTGLIPVYVPSIRVEHHIESERLTVRALYRRAFQLGQGRVYLVGHPEPELLARSPLLWKVRRVRDLLWCLARTSEALIPTENGERTERVVKKLIEAGRHAEALAVAQTTAAIQTTSRAQAPAVQAQPTVRPQRPNGMPNSTSAAS